MREHWKVREHWKKEECQILGHARVSGGQTASQVNRPPPQSTPVPGRSTRPSQTQSTKPANNATWRCVKSTWGSDPSAEYAGGQQVHVQEGWAFSCCVCFSYSYHALLLCLPSSSSIGGADPTHRCSGCDRTARWRRRRVHEEKAGSGAEYQCVGNSRRKQRGLDVDLLRCCWWTAGRGLHRQQSLCFVAHNLSLHDSIQLIAARHNIPNF